MEYPVIEVADRSAKPVCLTTVLGGTDEPDKYLIQLGFNDPDTDEVLGRVVVSAQQWNALRAEVASHFKILGVDIEHFPDEEE